MGKQKQASLLDKNLGTGEEIPFYVAWPINFIRFGVILILYAISLAFAILYFYQLVQMQANPSISFRLNNFFPPDKQYKAIPQQFPSFTVCNLEFDPLYVTRERALRAEATICSPDTTIVCGADRFFGRKHKQPLPYGKKPNYSGLFACPPPPSPIIIPSGFQGCRNSDEPVCAHNNGLTNSTNSTIAVTKRVVVSNPQTLQERRASNLAYNGNPFQNYALSPENLARMEAKARAEIALASPAQERPQLPKVRPPPPRMVQPPAVTDRLVGSRRDATMALEAARPLVNRIELVERFSTTSSTGSTTAGGGSTTTTGAGGVSSSTTTTGALGGGSSSTTTSGIGTSSSTTDGGSLSGSTTSSTSTSGFFYPCFADFDCRVDLIDMVVQALCINYQCDFATAVCTAGSNDCAIVSPDAQCLLTSYFFPNNYTFCGFSTNQTSFSDPCLTNPKLCVCTSDADCAPAVCEPISGACTAPCLSDANCTAGRSCIDFRCVDVSSVNASDGLVLRCASDSDCFSSDSCINGACTPNNRLRCFKDDQCPYAQICQKGDCILETCTDDDNCTWPDTTCVTETSDNFCAQRCTSNNGCPSGYSCLVLNQSSGNVAGACTPAARPPLFQLQARLATQCNATFSDPNTTLGCITFNEGGVYWARGVGRSFALELTVVVPSPQVKQVRIKGRDSLTWVVDPYNPFGIGVIYHRPGERDRVETRTYDDYAKPGLLTLQALSKEVSEFRITSPNRADVNRWAVIHGEMALPNTYNKAADTDINGYPVRLTVYLHIFFDTLETAVQAEVITYTIFNWFGDSTAVAGFLTGVCLWGGVSFVQMFKRPIDLLL